MGGSCSAATCASTPSASSARLLSVVSDDDKLATSAAVLFDRATSVEISADHIFDIAAAAGALVGTALLDIGRTVPFVAPVAYAIGTVVALAQTGEAFQLRADHVAKFSRISGYERRFAHLTTRKVERL